MDWIGERIRTLTEPFEGIWAAYQNLDPEQQRAVLILAPLAVLGLIAWLMYQTHGDRVVLVLPAMLARYSLLVLATPIVIAGKAAGQSWSMPGILTRDWTAELDPDRPEIPMREANPMSLPCKSRDGRTLKQIPADQWSIFGQDWKRLPSIGVISKAGGGKDEGLVGPAVVQELDRGVSDLIIMDPKLEQLAAALKYDYLPKNADVYLYGTSHRLNLETDAFDMFALNDVLGSPLSTARIITDEPSKDPHWGYKAAELLVAVREALIEMTSERIALDYVREVVADKEALDELRKESPAVANVADEEKEWGYIRSTAKRSLEPIKAERVRALFGSEGVRMPDFTSPRRQIVFLCPDSGAGDEEAKLTAAMVDVLVQLGRASGAGRVQKFILNEAGSFTSLPKLPHYVDIGRGEAIYMMYVLQSWSQLVTRLGTAGARNLWSGSAAQIVGQGAEPDLAQEMCGYADPVRRPHRQPRQLRDAPGGERISEERRPGLQPHHITGLGINEWVMRAAPEIYRFKVPHRYTQTEQLKKLRRRWKK